MYNVIKPPFTLQFSEMSEEELRRYFRWFLDIIPKRLEELRKAVNSTPGFDEWQADGSVGSISRLADWFVRQVEKRPRTPDEVEQIKEASRFPFPVPGWDLSTRTFSLAMDVGIYFAVALKKKYPHLYWDQSKRSKGDIDYGYAVLVGFGPMSLNPVQIIVSTAYGIASGKRGANRIEDLFSYWSGLADAHSHA
jgi:hypothetical protein